MFSLFAPQGASIITSTYKDHLPNIILNELLVFLTTEIRKDALRAEGGGPGQKGETRGPGFPRVLHREPHFPRGEEVGTWLSTCRAAIKLLRIKQPIVPVIEASPSAVTLSASLAEATERASPKWGVTPAYLCANGNALDNAALKTTSYLLGKVGTVAWIFF